MTTKNLLMTAPAAGGGAFSPLTAGHLDHAYDASSAVHSGDGTNLTSWDDLVGTLDLGTAKTNMPAYEASVTNLNGEPGVHFDLANTEGIGSGDVGTVYSNPITKFVILEVLSYASDDYVMASGASTRRADISMAGGSKWAMFKTSTGSAVGSDAPAAGAKAFLWAVYNGTGSIIRVNGVNTTGLSTGTTDTNGMTLGAWQSGGFNADCKIVYAGQGAGDLLTAQPTWVGEFETWANSKWSLGGWA